MTVSGARDLKEMNPAVLRGSRTWAAVSAGTALTRLPEALFCTGAGDATLIDLNGTEVAFVGFLAGVIYPLQPMTVKAGATATFVALY